MPQIATIRGRRMLNHFYLYFSLDHNMRLRMSDDQLNLNVNAVVTCLTSGLNVIITPY